MNLEQRLANRVWHYSDQLLFFVDFTVINTIEECVEELVFNRVWERMEEAWIPLGQRVK